LDDKNTKSIAVPKLAKSDVTKEALNFIAADSIVDASSVIPQQVLLKSGSGRILKQSNPVQC